MNACRLNNDHFLREMPPASSRAAVLGILTADITDLPISLPHVPLKSCQGGAKIKVTQQMLARYSTSGPSGAARPRPSPVPAGVKALGPPSVLPH